MARILRHILRKNNKYTKSILLGVIIHVNASENWCNVELQNGNVLYQIPFRSTNMRLRRLQQSVILTETHGQRQKYIITGESDVKVDSSVFALKGTFDWDSGALWSNFHIWG